MKSFCLYSYSHPGTVYILTLVQILSLEKIREQINQLQDNTILRIELVEQKGRGTNL